MQNFLENLIGRYHLEGICIGRRIILKWIVKERMWTGFIWLRMVSSGGLL